MKYVTLLLVILLAVPGKSQTASTDEDIEYDVELMKGDKAPFDGVLSPEETYRFYQMETARADSLDACCEKYHKSEMDSLNPILKGVFYGLLMGFGYCFGTRGGPNECF
jgi:hypothetical protein